MNVLQSLKSLSSYPTPTATLQDIAEGASLEANADLTPEIRNSAEFKRAKARAYLYLVTAPNISQNGISFSFTSDERKQFRKIACDILAELGDDISAITGKNRYGYRGSDF